MGVTFKHHDAEEDACACALIALEACRHANVTSLYEFRDVFGLRVGRMFDSGYSPCGAAYARKSSAKRKIPLCASDVVPSPVEFDTLNPCYGAAFVFTGVLSSIQRKGAMQLVVDHGGICHDRVKNDTNFLVLGREGFAGYEIGHKSSKIRRAEELRLKGFQIEIISEEDFLTML